MTFWDNTTVQSLGDGDVVVVGEEHGNVFSRDLMRRVLDAIRPNTLAIEMPPGRSAVSGGGMREAKQYATRNDSPLLAIDKDRTDLRSTTGSYMSMVSDANVFTHPITVDGDVEVRAITDVRNRIRDDYGREPAREMYTRREQEMAKNLRTATENYPTPIVAGVGTFHILALRDIYPTVEPKDELPQERILNGEPT